MKNCILVGSFLILALALYWLLHCCRREVRDTDHAALTFRFDAEDILGDYEGVDDDMAIYTRLKIEANGTGSYGSCILPYLDGMMSSQVSWVIEGDGSLSVSPLGDADVDSLLATPGMQRVDENRLTCYRWRVREMGKAGVREYDLYRIQDIAKARNATLQGTSPRVIGGTSP